MKTLQSNIKKTNFVEIFVEQTVYISFVAKTFVQLMTYSDLNDILKLNIYVSKLPSLENLKNKLPRLEKNKNKLHQNRKHNRCIKIKMSLFNRNFELGVGGEGQDTSRHLRIVLDPYVQYCPCEASEQKPEQEP